MFIGICLYNAFDRTVNGFNKQIFNQHYKLLFLFLYLEMENIESTVIIISRMDVK